MQQLLAINVRSLMKNWKNSDEKIYYLLRGIWRMTFKRAIAFVVAYASHQLWLRSVLWRTYPEWLPYPACWMTMCIVKAWEWFIFYIIHI